MTGPSLTPDQQRALDLSRNVIVQAGAGSGKTTLLVARYLALFAADPALEPSAVVALTFTEQAAGEMAARVRRAVASGGGSPRLAAGLEALRIQTIHAFALGLLRDHAPAGAPVELEPPERAGPRRRQVLEETITDLAWGDPGPLLPLAEVFGRGALTSLLGELLTRRALVTRWLRDVLAHDDEAAFVSSRLAEQADWTRVLVSSLVADPAWRRMRARLSALRGTVDEPLAGHLGRLEAALAGSATLTAAGPAALQAHLDELIQLIDRGRGVWRADPVASERLGPAIVDLRDLLGRRRPSARTAAIERLAASTEYHLARLTDEALGRWTRDLASRGRLDVDALVPEATRLLDGQQTGVRCLLIDELQDTDREQWALVRRLIGADEGPPPAGSLFGVGDAKQSIYRFRGAEVSVLGDAESLVAGAASGLAVTLADNFRSRREVLDVIGATFDRVLAPEGDDWQPYEARPQRLRVGRDPRSGEVGARGAGGRVALRVAVVPSPPPPEDLSLARWLDGGDTREAMSVAACLAERIAAGRAPEEMAVLLRTRAKLGLLEAALAAAGVPFVVWRGSGFYQRQEVRDLVALLRTLLDPDDDMALLAVLRAPLVGLSDVALTVLAAAGPGSLWTRLTAIAARPDGLDARDRAVVGRVVGWLPGARFAVVASPVASVLRAALEDTGAWVAYAAAPDGEQVLANLEKLLSICRAADEGPGQLLERLERRVASTTEPEGQAPIELEGRPGVRIMTVHAAKGLEFGVVIVSDLARRARPATAATSLVEETALGPRVGLRLPADELLATGLPPEGRSLSRLALAAEIEARERAEAKRLLYVACTRAVDELVLSVALCPGDEGLQPPGAGGRVWTWWSMLASAWGLGEALPASLDRIELGDAGVDVERIAADPPAGRVDPPDLAGALLAELGEAE